MIIDPPAIAEAAKRTAPQPMIPKLLTATIQHIAKGTIDLGFE